MQQFQDTQQKHLSQKKEKLSSSFLRPYTQPTWGGGGSTYTILHLSQQGPPQPTSRPLRPRTPGPSPVLKGSEGETFQELGHRCAHGHQQSTQISWKETVQTCSNAPGVWRDSGGILKKDSPGGSESEAFFQTNDSRI